MKHLENKIMLITYADSMGQNLSDLIEILSKYFKGTIGGVHILPFYPSSGDRGFAPKDYTQVDTMFGSWSDIEKLSFDYYLMFDFMLNHISAQSSYYQDFLQKKEESDYKDFFIRYKDFWPECEPTPDQVKKIYKRKPKAPYVEASFNDGSTEKIWCTFGEEQIDLNCTTESTKNFIRDNLLFLARHGAALIRLDAFAYACKKVDTNCFFVEPEIWDLLSWCADIVHEMKVALLPEIHEHYSIQQKIAQQGYYVYDFALPMLMLNAIYYKNTHYLKEWLKICPRNQFTTLDTHDGIGVVDVVDLLPDNEIMRTKESIFKFGANVKKVYSSEAYNNLDIYQVNCTFYSALGDDDNSYLMARAIQFFSPGIPQVYYVGLLAGGNDLQLLEQTKEGRNINRHYFTLDEVAQEINRPVIQKLLELMRFRNSHPAFDGEFKLLETEDNTIELHWDNKHHYAYLFVDFSSEKYTIIYSSKHGEGEIRN